MKTNLKGLFSVIFLLISVIVFTQNSKKAKDNDQNSFFTQKDTSNWFYILKDKSLHPKDVFKMNDGILHISGASSGYLRTKRNYSNFTLNVDWRWTKSLGNSGVLVHIQPKDTIWPACYQVQQKSDAAGDMLCMNGLWAKECTDSVKFTIKKMQVSNEKPLGEWNSMQVISKNKTLKVFVNGVLQNYITHLTASKGFIGFQNEGKPLEFKNLSIKSEK
jgi:hypothetical protein